MALASTLKTCLLGHVQYRRRVFFVWVGDNITASGQLRTCHDGYKSVEKELKSRPVFRFMVGTDRQPVRVTKTPRGG